MKMALVFAAFALSANAGDPARDLADQVFKASGGEKWPQVEIIRFTFNVAQGDKLLLSASHDWHVRSRYDLVALNGKKWAVEVPGHKDDTANANYQRWVNDSYWLLMPLKLKDPGVKLNYVGRQGEFEVLELGFNSVGVTPTDRYKLYIDPKTHLVRRWDYMPSPDKTISGTWDGYKSFSGLKLATEHQFGDKRIWFTRIRVTRERPPMFSVRTQFMLAMLCIGTWMVIWGCFLKPARHAHVPGEHGTTGGGTLESANRWWSYRGPPH